MRYLLKITIVAVLGLFLFPDNVMAQTDTALLGERLGSRAEALMEMSIIGQVYSSIDLLSYDVSYDFADSTNRSAVLEHKDGKYGMFDGLFWGSIDSTEYLQGQQYYVVVDHQDKSIYVYNKLNYSRAINVPLLDSIFNEVSLKDLVLTRPGGIYKKLLIQYKPDMQYKQVEMVYDSTTHLLRSIAYLYNTTVHSEAYYNCEDTVTTLIIPSTGVSMPGTVTCTSLLSTYRNFIAEFPNRTKGATVRVYVGTTSAVVKSDENMQADSEQLLAAMKPDNDIKELFVAAAVANNARRDSITPPPPSKKLMATALAAGVWVDSTMAASRLFEWYMNEHLGVQYTANVYADWLANGCGYKFYQLPWGQTAIARADTLQNIWNRFVTRYPSSQTTISETIGVPVIKGMVTSTEYSADAYETEYLRAATWTSNSVWSIVREANTYDFSVLPKNASIQSASLNLYAFGPTWFFAPHFRYVNQFPFMQLQPIKGLFIPGKTTANIRPENYAGMPVVNLPYLSTNQINSGNPDDFWSSQNYTGQNVLSLVNAMYNNVQTTGVNYPVQYKLNDESYAYKVFHFGGTECSNVSKRPVLNVAYTASRCDVFTAFVNRTLGTNLSYEQVVELYKYSGKLDINSNCTTAATGLGCADDGGKPITGVTTITFNKTDETTFDLNLFGETRFFYKVGDTFSPQSNYSDYRLVPVLNN